MIKLAINLAKNTVEKKVDDKRYFIIPLAIFIVIFLATMGVLGYNFLLKNKLNELETEANNLGITINSEPILTKKNRVLLIRERLTFIDQVMGKRNNLYVKVASILETIPSGVIVQDIDTRLGEIKISGQTENLAAFDQYTKSVQRLMGNTKDFSKVRVELMNYSNKEDKWSISLIFSY